MQGGTACILMASPSLPQIQPIPPQIPRPAGRSVPGIGTLALNDYLKKTGRESVAKTGL